VTCSHSGGRRAQASRSENGFAGGRQHGPVGQRWGRRGMVKQDLLHPSTQPETLRDQDFDPEDYQTLHSSEWASEALLKEALRHFGETHSPHEAGFVLPDGRMVDFSESRDGGGGFRSLDHRAVERLYQDKERTRAMWDFVSRGAARAIFQPGLVGIDFHQPLTDAQVRAVCTAVARERGAEFVADRRDADGEVLGSAHLPFALVSEVRRELDRLNRIALPDPESNGRASPRQR
jgi:hypothetical protein